MDTSQEEVEVDGTWDCYDPCGTHEERTSPTDETCKCETLYEDLNGDCVLSCTGG